VIDVSGDPAWDINHTLVFEVLVFMRKTTSFAALAVLMMAPIGLGIGQGGSAWAQAPSTQWFVPGQPKAASPAPRPAAPRPPAAAEPAVEAQGGGPLGSPLGGLPPDAGAEPGGVPAAQMQLPPAPEVPPLQRGPTPPAAIVGILSVPDVLRVSTAYQAAYKELNGRAQKLNEDAQKEQATLREMGQAFAADRAKMSPEQIRTKETEITTRATEAQRKFGERNRIIQEAGQYVMAQINRTTEQVAQSVASSRGVNLVLNRAQILGTTADFDLTPAVAEVLNKILPSVVVPPDGVSPLAMAAPAGATPAAAASTAPAKPAPTKAAAQKH
jgi:Skp family chaperone for outer membrane proteins